MVRTTAAFLCFAIALTALPNQSRGASDWLSAPKPKFPAGALQKGSEGSVSLRIVLAKDGSVTNVTVLKSSGNSLLDETARSAVLKWKMKPSAIKASDLEKGRYEIIEFRQEAPIAATYRGWGAAFHNEQAWKPWIFAPFPAYPTDARALHHTGTVILAATIGSDGKVVEIEKVKTSGYGDLDESAVSAVRHWQAHKEYTGQKLRFPITFQMTRP